MGNGQLLIFEFGPMEGLSPLADYIRRDGIRGKVLERDVQSC